MLCRSDSPHSMAGSFAKLPAWTGFGGILIPRSVDGWRGVGVRASVSDSVTLAGCDFCSLVILTPLRVGGALPVRKED